MKTITIALLALSIAGPALAFKSKFEAAPPAQPTKIYCCWAA